MNKIKMNTLRLILAVLPIVSNLVLHTSWAMEAEDLKNEIIELSKLLPKVTKLNLSHRSIKVLPNEIHLLTELKELNLDHNELMQLPDSIGHLAQLEVLKVGHNKLTELPDSIG